MLSPRWQKAIGDVRAHRGRTLLAVLAIAAGLAGAGIVLDAWALVKVATRDGFLTADPPAATIHVDSVTPALLDRVRAVPGVRAAESRRTIIARAGIEGSTFRAMLFVVEDPARERIGAVKLEAGAWARDDASFTVERSSIAFSGAAMEGGIALSVGDGAPLPLRITGIARDVTLAPGWMEHLVYGFVSPATLRALGVPSHPNEIRIVVSDRTLDEAGVRRIALAVRDTIRAAGVRIDGVDVPVPGEHVHAAQMDSLLYTQGAFGLLALICSAFLVVNLITGMLAGQVREIGILKTLGGRTTQIATLYLAIAAAIGVASVAVSLPIAMVAGRQYAELKADLLNFDLAGVALPSWVIAAQVLVGLLLPVAAAVLPVRAACSRPVADALRDVGISDQSAPPAVLYRMRGVNRPLLLSLRNAFRRRQRLVLTLLALSAAGAVFLGARNLRLAVLGATDRLFAANQYDFSLRLAAPADADSLTAWVRAVGGVDRAEAWTGASAITESVDGLPGDAYPLTAAPAGSELLVPPLIAGRALTANDTLGLIVGRATLRADPTIAVGASMTLTIGDVTAQWQVIGIAEGGPTPTLYATREAIQRITRAGVATVVVRSTARGEASQLELIGRVRAALAERGLVVASSTRLVESRRVMEDHLLMVVDLLGAVGWLMLVVGGLGLGSTMAIAVLERTREIGVLRAIGARDGAVMRLVVAEGLAMGLMGWLIAIPLSIPMSRALGAAFGRIMVPVASRTLPDGASTATWLALVLVISFAASAWPAWRASRVPAARALSYE